MRVYEVFEPPSYIDEPLRLPFKSFVIAYADDIKLGNIPADAHYLQADLDLLSDWFTFWFFGRCCA